MREFYGILPTVRSYVPYLFIHIWGVEIPLNVTTINEVLEVPKFQILEFEDSLGGCTCSGCEILFGIPQDLINFTGLPQRVSLV